MKRIIVAVLSFAVLLPFVSMNAQAIDASKTLPTDDEEYIDSYIPTSELLNEPDEVRRIIDEDGIATTEHIFRLPEDGGLPYYITDIEYQDDPDAVLIDEYFPNEDDMSNTGEDWNFPNEDGFCLMKAIHMQLLMATSMNPIICLQQLQALLPLLLSVPFVNPLSVFSTGLTA